MTPLAELMFAGDYLDECLRLIHPTCNDDLCDICTARWQDAVEYTGAADEDGATADLAEMLLAGQVTDDTTARLFAADCAEHVLHHFEDVFPDDTRPRKAIDAARAYARGTISREEMAAAQAAARDAVQAAVRAAVRDAARAAARAAARDAARAAARAAAGDAAGDAALDAARDAARAAALDAALAAALAAAGAAARAAALDAAWDAEREWQANRLGELCGLNPTSDTVAGRPQVTQ